MDIKVKVYDGVKYLAGSEKVAEVEYHGIKGWDIVSDPSTVEEIESCTDANSIDDYHEYLIIILANGETATFRNSYVDMFRI